MLMVNHIALIEVKEAEMVPVQYAALFRCLIPSSELHTCFISCDLSSQSYLVDFCSPSFPLFSWKTETRNKKKNSEGYGVDRTIIQDSFDTNSMQYKKKYDSQCSKVILAQFFFFFLVRQMVSPLFTTTVRCRSSRLP